MKSVSDYGISVCKFSVKTGMCFTHLMVEIVRYTPF